VHTGVTGSGPAYKTAEDEREEALAKQAEEPPLSESEDAFIDLQPTAHERGSQVHDDVIEPARASTESEPTEMLDLEEETETFVAEATQEAMPDDSFAVIEAAAPEAMPEASFEPQSDYTPEPSPEQEPSYAPEMGSEPESGFETVETYTSQSTSDAIPPLEIEDFAADALTPTASSDQPSEETPEPPRATFAERGFDGSVDEMGWMTTPSQAFSDLEAAPEDWLEETSDEASPAEESRGAEPVSAEASASPVGEAGAPEDHATDSWFDQVPGANSIEATEVTSDELWLPPELPQVTNAEANVRAPEESELSAEAPSEVPAWSAPMGEEEPAAAAPEVAETVSTGAHAEQEEVSEPLEITPYAQAKPAWMPDDAVQPVEAESAHEDMASASVEPDVSYDEDVHPVEVTSASVAEPEPAAHAEASEYEDQHDADAPPFVYAADSSAGPSSGSAIGQTPTDAVPAATPAPFLTETLADLYLQQGFRDEALAIYRQLLDRNPADETLKSRIAALEQREVPPPAPVSAETRAASQSVRTFFSRLARRPATVPPVADRGVGGRGGGGAGGAGNSGGQPDVPFSVAASALANLFSASKPPQADEGAASTLAGAFTDPAGRPSRAAERELSLDHLFRDVAPGGPAAGGVTLDEFYSTPSSGTGSSTEPGSESGPEDPSGTDIRQFTAWLEGLRKK
jgi:hypothetical protein